MRLDHFEDDDGHKFVNMYLARNENMDDYQMLIDELSKKHLVTIFVLGKQPIVDTIKRMLSDD